MKDTRGALLKDSRRDTTILEPFTKISGFDGIGYAANKSIIGAVGRFLFPDKDEERRKFYISTVGRRNKQRVAELVSEVYAFLNGVISEHADPRQYYFRLLVRMTIDSKTGEILGQSAFDIDVFRHIGKIGGKPTEVKGYILKVAFVGKEGVPISQVFIKGLSEAVRNTGMVDFKPYETYSSAPKEIRDMITKTRPYLVIGDEAHEIKVKVDEKSSKITPYIEEEEECFEFNAENDVVLFVLKKIPIKPEIFGSETAFELVDKEISGFTPKMAGTVDESKKFEWAFKIGSLGIEDFVNNFSKKFTELDSANLSIELNKQLTRNKTILEEFRQRYDKLKTNYEVTEQELVDLEKERNDGKIEEDIYRCTKKRRLLAVSAFRTDLIKLHREMKDEVQPQMRTFLRNFKKTTKGEKKTVK